MKTKKILRIICVLAIVPLCLFGQKKFTYRGWELNKIVNFNDVINNIDDNSKIITSAYMYQKGEDIKFHDIDNSTTTLCFFENTQILQCIFVHDFTNIYWVNYFRESIIGQLGKPTYGYEIKNTYDIKDNSYADDYSAYKMEYLYLIPKYWISISIYSLGLTSFRDSRTYIPLYKLSACIYERLESDTEAPYQFYPELADDDCRWVVIKSELINKW